MRGLRARRGYRRIYMGDLLKYKAKRDGRRRKILDDLVQAETEDGLYDRQQSANAQSR